MNRLTRLINAYKALVQLGIQSVLLNALYRLGLASGHYRRLEQKRPSTIGQPLRPLFTFPSVDELLDVIGQEGKNALLAEADEIASGKVRLFGAEPVVLDFNLPGKLFHWTAYETGRADIRQLTTDPKLLWEPARFGWAFCLGRAYHLTGDENYPQTFWKYFELFMAVNPAFLGPNWISGQEAALRLMAFAWASQIFEGSPASTPERKTALANAVAVHAARIPATLVYARSQQNNHLLTESAGLFTAGLALPDHPNSARWRALGWKWLNQGLLSQIDSYGEYGQHSTNYQRLMLQVVLWINGLIHRDTSAQFWPNKTKQAVVRSIHWMLAIVDSETGRMPNLGANDGAYIFPLTVCPFSNYRPVLHAAAHAFLDYDLPHGNWDELALWFGIPLENRYYTQLPRYLGDQIYGKESWAYLRTAQFTNRPSHADQLHVDLWWRGLNVAQDAGTYLYNADPPWDNRLTSALVHNTITVDHRDQFTRAGRFLYLDWFNAFRRGKLVEDPAILQQVQGRHWGYWRQGVRHERTVTTYVDGHWQVCDDLLPLRMPWAKRPILFRLHWLLPDWEWQVGLLEGNLEIRLNSPQGGMTLKITSRSSDVQIDSQVTIVRAGEMVFGAGPVDPIRGWASPTYGVKIPALSLAVETKSPIDVQFMSEFIFTI